MDLSAVGILIDPIGKFQVTNKVANTSRLTEISSTIILQFQMQQKNMLKEH